jgi:histone-lysine N-methyltransferase SETMAR
MFFDIKDTVHFEFAPKGQTADQTSYVEILKRLHENVHRERPDLWHTDWILHHDNAPAHKVLSVKQFLAHKSITEIEHPPCSPDLAPNGFLLFPEIKSALKTRRFQVLKTSKQKCDDGTESYSTTGVPKTLPTVAASLG